MKVICISNEYVRHDGSISSFKDLITIHKIYDIIVDSSLESPLYKTVYRIKCDDGYNRVYPEEMMMSIDLWREQQLNKILC